MKGKELEAAMRVVTAANALTQPQTINNGAPTAMALVRGDLYAQLVDALASLPLGFPTQAFPSPK